MVPTFAMAALDMVLGVAYYGDHRWSAMDADPTRRKPWSAPSARSRPKGSWSASPARSRTPSTRFRTATMCGSPPRPPWTWRLRWPGSCERPGKRSDGCGSEARRSDAPTAGALRPAGTMAWSHGPPPARMGDAPGDGARRRHGKANRRGGARAEWPLHRGAHGGGPVAVLRHRRAPLPWLPIQLRGEPPGPRRPGDPHLRHARGGGGR